MHATTQRRSRKGTIEPLLLAHPRARKILDVGETKYRELVKAGAIEVVKVGRSSMATYASLKQLAGAA